MNETVECVYVRQGMLSLCKQKERFSRSFLMFPSLRIINVYVDFRIVGASEGQSQALLPGVAFSYLLVESS